MGGTSLKTHKNKSSKEGLETLRKAKSRNGKEPKGAIQKKAKPSKEKAPKKLSAKKAQEEEPNKRSRSRTKKKQQEESSSEDEEAAQEADVDDDAVAEEDNRRDEAVSEDEDDGKTSDDKRKSQVRLKARRRGYRHVAEMAGFSARYASGASHLDVSTPVLSENETIRACQFAPKLADKPAYASLEEFEERTDLSLESLPKSAAKVIRMSGDAYLRRLAVGAMQRASDQQKTRVSVNMVQSETRPLQRAQKYSFVAPHGLVRFAQTQDNANHRIEKLDEDLEQIAAEKKGLLKAQPKKRDALIAEKAAHKMAQKGKKKKKSADADAEQPQAEEEDSIAKKRKKRASSV